MNEEHITFVYSDYLNSLSAPINIKCLYLNEAKAQQKQLEKDGWVLTATIAPAAWIEHLCNSGERTDNKIIELQEGASRSASRLQGINVLES